MFRSSVLACTISLNMFAVVAYKISGGDEKEARPVCKPRRRFAVWVWRMKLKGFSPLVIGCLLLASPTIAKASFVTSPTSLNANDSIFWSQLGTSGSVVPESFHAISVDGMSAQISFNQSSGGTVASVCPAVNCNFAGAPGFDAGDSLLWAEGANGNGTGPLTVAFATPVSGVGFYFQLTAPATFSAMLTKVAGANTASEIVTSDNVGDPIFLGALDGQTDITGFEVTGITCTPLSPGVCNAADFAIDAVSLTAVPEPKAVILIFIALILLTFRAPWARDLGCRYAIPFLFLLLFTVPAALYGQEPVPIPPDEAPPIEITDRNSSPSINAAAPLVQAYASVASNAASPLVQPNAPAASFPTWRYQVSSPVNGLTYSGYMVGTSPFNRGARTTTVQAILVPFVISFNNTTTGFTATFDPSSAPDVGCTAGQTAMSLVESSPLFQNQNWTLNGIDVGTTQYIDAYQRANFWQYVQNTGDAYHVLLDYSVGDPLFLSLQYASPTLAAEVRTPLQSPCTNASVSGSTNGGNLQGLVDFTTLQNAMLAYIASHGITPDKFPIFLVYNVMYSQNGSLFLGGYHFSIGATVTSPGQTFALANFRTNGTGPFDISILSHEIAEWVNDPGAFNGTPAWFNLNEATCQRGLEVGDALTRTDLPVIAGPYGFSYHLQELVFFSWFFRTPSIGAGAVFSNNGTFTFDAGAVCQ